MNKYPYTNAVKLLNFAMVTALVGVTIFTSPEAHALSAPVLSNAGNPQVVGQSPALGLSPTVWGMTAANPQRTSWVSGASNELKGNLSVAWYRVIDPYIDNKVQVIASDSKVFISTSKGLYAFNANNFVRRITTQTFIIRKKLWDKSKPGNNRLLVV